MTKTTLRSVHHCIIEIRK